MVWVAPGADDQEIVGEYLTALGCNPLVFCVDICNFVLDEVYTRLKELVPGLNDFFGLSNPNGTRSMLGW